jgi:hypothetical protein
MRVCYHVQSHRCPAQVERLVRTLKAASPDSFVHVSHDRAGPPLDVPALQSLPGVVVVPGRGGYGDWTHVQRWLDAADWLVDEGVGVDWLVNLTGTDYPLRPLAEIEAELAGSTDGFLQWYDALSPTGNWDPRRSRSRYYFRHRRIAPLSQRQRALLRPLQGINRVQPLVRVHVSYGLTAGVRARVPFSRELRLYGGSAYASLSWRCVEHVRDVVRNRPRLVEHFRHTLSPEEAFLQTVLVNSGRFALVNDCKRYFDFSGSRFNHPRVLGPADLPRALASGAHFGRKFDLDRDPDVYDALDARVLSPRP